MELPAQVRDLFALARSDRRAAENAIGSLAVDEQVALVCQTPVARRAEVLELMPEPEFMGEFRAPQIGLGD